MKISTSDFTHQKEYLVRKNDWTTLQEKMIQILAFESSTKLNNSLNEFPSMCMRPNLIIIFHK